MDLLSGPMSALLSQALSLALSPAFTALGSPISWLELVAFVLAVLGTLAWLWLVEGTRPDRWDLAGGALASVLMALAIAATLAPHHGGFRRGLRDLLGDRTHYPWRAAWATLSV